MSGFRLTCNFPRRHSSPAVFLLLLLVGLRCDESLPPRDQPVKYVSVFVIPDTIRINVLLADLDVDIRYDGDFEVIAGVGNLIDEVVQDSAAVNVALTLSISGGTRTSTVLTAGPNDLVFPARVTDGLVTILPGDTVRVRCRWPSPQIWPNHRVVWYVNQWSFKYDNRGRAYVENRVLMQAQATVRLFKYGQPMTTDPVNILAIYNVYP